MIENPIFIVGSERSGSNLLRLILNQAKEVLIPHPPHIMRDLSPLLVRYGSLEDDEAFARLVHDCIRLVELHFAPWPIKLNAAAVLKDSKERNLYAIYAAIYEQYRLHENKPRWGCKSTFMIHFVPEILRHHRAPQFIHLVRDVRDVAVSARHSVFSRFHPYFLAKQWNQEQSLAHHWEQKLGQDVWLKIRFEDLVNDPKSELMRLSRGLNIEYSEEMLHYFSSPQAQSLSSLSESWKNVGRPLDSSKVGRYISELRPEEVAVIESVCSKNMELNGYAPVHKIRSLRKSFTSPELLKFHLIEKWGQLSQEARALVLDKNAILRMRRRAFLWRLHWR